MSHPWKRRSAETVGINLTPLLDVVLQLLTFFMMLIHFGSKIEGESRWARLPVAPAALANGELGFDRLIAIIDDRGALRDGDRALAGNAAELWWDEQARSRREGRRILAAKTKVSVRDEEELPTTVIIRADRDAGYGTVRQALATAQKKGFAKFSLVVLRGVEP